MKRMTRMHSVAAVSGIAMTLGLGCSSNDNVELAKPAASDSALSLGGLRASVVAPSLAVDVAAVRFAVVGAGETCSDEPIASAQVPLEEEAFPTASGNRAFAERFFTLPADDYRVCALPLRTGDEPSRDCEEGEIEIEVRATETADAQISIQCAGSQGGLSAVATFNTPPVLQNVVAEPSRSITECDSIELKALVEDMEGDDFEVSWEVLTEGAQLTTTLGEETTFSASPGRHEVRMSASDAEGATASVVVPVFVTDDACAGAFEIPFEPEPTQGQALQLSDDQISQPLELGFPFSFFDQEFDSVRVSSNGFLIFGEGATSSGCCSGRVIPEPDGTNGIAAFAWTDWNPRRGGRITASTVGQSPNRRFILDFIMVPEFGGGGEITTQVKLFEQDNAVEVHTEQMLGVGGIVTQGVEDPTGTIAFSLPGRVRTNFSLEGDAVRFLTAGASAEAECGDGVTQAGEQCDDGNTAAGDGCSPDCQVEVLCGTVDDCLGVVCESVICSCVDNFCDVEGSCETVSDCLGGFSCVGGRCNDIRACTSDDQCALGICDLATGTCVRCQTDSDCGPGRLCHPLSESCVACVVDADCAAGQLCSEQGRCVECTDNADCASGLCDPGLGECIADAECLSFGDCGPGGLACLQGVCADCMVFDPSSCGPDATCSSIDGFLGQCVSIGECQTAAECAPGEQCEDGQCVEGVACVVNPPLELFITDLSVLEDPVRAAPGGPWSFGGLMRATAASPEEAPALVEAMFDTWRTDQVINSFTVDARPEIGPRLLDAWPRLPTGELDLDQSPLTLNAIINRVDMRNLDEGHAGEGRFVFAVNQPGSPFPQQFTVILEYLLPASSEHDVLDWAEQWHALGQLPFPSEEYNGALQGITERFAGRGALPAGVNGSALGQIRTNEIALSPLWELRQFELSAATSRLAPVAVEKTPDLFAFNNSSTLGRFINQNESLIVAERHTLPLAFEGQPFLAGAAPNFQRTWNAPGVNNPEARHKFAINTCSGCHGPEAGIFNFLQVDPRTPGNEPRLSGFLTGTTVRDPVTGQSRTLNDLARRQEDLEFLACGEALASIDAGASSGRDAGAPLDDPQDAGPSDAGAPMAPELTPPLESGRRSIRRGISRVH